MAGTDAACRQIFTERRKTALLDAAAFETGEGVLQIAEVEASGIALVSAHQANEATHIRILAPKHYF